MRTIWISACLFATLPGGAASLAFAQREDSPQGSSTPDRMPTDAPQNSSSRELESDPEYRLRYDDDQDRLSVDVDEDIRIRDDRRIGESRDFARDAEFDLRYDSDRQDLRAEGGGTIDIDRAASALASWWESWWQDEERARRSAREGMDRGVREFLRQHDDDGDGLVTRRELPQAHRDEFSYVDRNRDGNLSRNELERFGGEVYNLRRRAADGSRTAADSRRRTSQTGSERDQTWSQWWASRWSDGNEDARTGADRLLRLHDRDDDGYLTRRELPSRMADDFRQVDRNDDGYLSRTELRVHGDALHDSRGGSRSAQTGQRGSGGEQTWAQWWSSWFADESQQDRPLEDIAASGAREFIGRHDENDDGYLVRSELPSRMHDDFDQIDANNDSYLTRSEITRQAERTSSGSRSRASTAGRNQRLGDSRKPVELAYVWIIDVNQGATSREDLQEAFNLLTRIDENGDGELSAGELRQNREHIAADWSENRFDRLDRSGDGRLSESEAQGTLIGQQFAAFDRDQNGSLSVNEVNQTLQERFASRDSDTRRE